VPLDHCSWGRDLTPKLRRTGIVPAKNGPKCGRRHQGATNLTGPSFLPVVHPGEQVIKLSEAPFVPNVGSVRCQLDVTEALLFWAANSARKGRR